MTGWLLKLVLIFVILRAIYLLLRGVWRGLVEAASVPRDSESRSPRSTRGTLVQDPVCGTFVVRERALSSRLGGETHFFCSDQCRRQYEARSA